MYLRTHIDWTDPLYRKWKLPEELSTAQMAAFLAADDSEVKSGVIVFVWNLYSQQFPLSFFFSQITTKPLTQDDMVRLCTTVPCRVSLWRGNLCRKAEKKWPRNFFKKRTFSDLCAEEREQMYERLARTATKMCKKIDIESEARRYCRSVTRNTLAPFWQERYLAERYSRVMQANENDVHDDDNESIISSSSQVSNETVIFNASEHVRSESNSHRNEATDISRNTDIALTQNNYISLSRNSFSQNGAVECSQPTSNNSGAYNVNR